MVSIENKLLYLQMLTYFLQTSSEDKSMFTDVSLSFDRSRPFQKSFFSVPQFVVG